MFNFLPQTGIPGVLIQDLTNPGSTVAGELAGQLVALTINVDFSSVGFPPRTTPMGDLRICGFSSAPAVNGMTVSAFLAAANSLLGGSISALTPDDATLVAARINTAFLGGAPSNFAQSNLRVGSCT